MHCFILYYAFYYLSRVSLWKFESHLFSYDCFFYWILIGKSCFIIGVANCCRPLAACRIQQYNFQLLAYQPCYFPFPWYPSSMPCKISNVILWELQKLIQPQFIEFQSGQCEVEMTNWLAVGKQYWGSETCNFQWSQHTNSFSWVVFQGQVSWLG